MEAEPWSDPDDLAVDSEPGGSNEDRDNAPLTEMMRPQTCAFSTGTVQPPPPPRRSSARDVPLQGLEDRVEGMIPHPLTDCRGHDEQGSRGDAEEGDDDDDGVGRGYEGSSEDDDDPNYSPTRRRGDDDDGGGDEVAASPGQFVEVAVGSAKVVAASAEVAAGSAEVAASYAEAVAKSAKTAVGSVEIDGVAAEVGRASTQFGAIFSDDMFGALLGLPPTPTGERGSGGVDAQAMPISQILRGLPACSVGDISSSMLWEVAEETQCSLGQHEHVVGDVGGCGPVQERVTESEQERTDREKRERVLELARRCEMTQSISARARAERMLETSDGAGHCMAEDAEVECGGAVGGDAGERPASLVHGVCVLPFAGALSAEEFERQAREDPLWADRRGRMDEASRRVMAEGPAYVSCSPSIPSSTTDVILTTHPEGPGPTPSPASAPAGESPSPKSRKKKMRAGKGRLSTVRSVTHQMRVSQPGLAGLHPRTLEALGRNVVAYEVGWRERASTRGTEQPMSAPAEAAVPRPRGRTSTTTTKELDEHSHAPGRSMAGRILGVDVRALTTQRSSQTPVGWESGSDDLEMPIGQRKRVSV
ncbi:hypothetical protein CBR_g50960 [Chara braunii]|uniref:Uncharacterized protein n=1 Tax=Chara braunii TaxID=69332 RepID=A0A388M7V3_CHABU|nr:hypothetical protein CBR_g50960 [Chara braunii]|eukprot:GBG90616.1 hypothetical protein CBR_g50960 [Chara braunii]